MFNKLDTNLVFIGRDDDKGTITFERKCPFCSTVVRREFQLDKLEPADTPSKCIQDILPKLNSDEREFFMTGICTPCWNKM